MPSRKGRKRTANDTAEQEKNAVANESSPKKAKTTKLDAPFSLTIEHWCNIAIVLLITLVAVLLPLLIKSAVESIIGYLALQYLDVDTNITPIRYSIKRACAEYSGTLNATQTEEVTHIGFLKVHKAGSTTITNLLFRFGVRHNLTFALPSSLSWIFSKESVLPLKTKDHYDILAVHTKYNKHLYDSILPVGSAKIAIIRDPLTRASSAAYYYRDILHVRYLKRIPKEGFMKHLINNPERYELTQPFSFTKNQMANDFGFSKHLNNSHNSAISGYLKYLNREFSLVLVMERFQESLVLMKRMFHWSTQDIMYLKCNSHYHKPANYTDAERRKFRETNFLDYAIYDYFTKEFDKKVKTERNDFQEEVKHFKDIVKSIQKFCSEKSGIKKLIIPKHTWNEEFEVTWTDCVKMETSTMYNIWLLRRRHRHGHF